MLSSPTSEEVRMLQLLHAAMQVVPLLPHFSFSREFVSPHCRSRNYPQDLKSQLPIRIMSMTMFFSDGFNIFRGTGFYLISDGHSYDLSLKCSKYCTGRGTEMLCPPLHTTHVLQPLDRTMLKPFKTCVLS